MGKTLSSLVHMGRGTAPAIRRKRAHLAALSELRSLHLKISCAYNLKMAFQDFYDQPPDVAEADPLHWYNWAI